MSSTAENIDRNRRLFNQRYSGVDLSLLLHRVENHERFLADATVTDAGWVSFYYGDFRQRLKGARVLELGCGNGLNALIMAKHGASVVAIDIAEEGPQTLKRLAKAAGLSARIETHAGDFRELSFEPRSFDFVVGQAFLHHLTHDLEDEILRRSASLVKPDGEARFAEPAINSKTLDQMRWLVPVPGRPSILSRKAFARWRDADAHPARDNSTAHFEAVGRRYFDEVEIVTMGGIDRLYRFFPRKEATRRFRRWAWRFERRLPERLNRTIARIQTVMYRKPRSDDHKPSDTLRGSVP